MLLLKGELGAAAVPEAVLEVLGVLKYIQSTHALKARYHTIRHGGRRDRALPKPLHNWGDRLRTHQIAEPADFELVGVH